MRAALKVTAPSVTRARASLCVTAAFLSGFLFAARVSAQSRQHRHGAGGGGAEAAVPGGTSKGVMNINRVEREIPDFILRNQDGRDVRFYTDLIKGKVVVLSFFYTDCAFVCDGQGRNLAKLQTLLGDRLGRDVFLVSVTRTPAADNPARLKAWANRYGVKPGWTLLTGRTPEVARLVVTFARDSIGPQESHSAPVFVGNDATNTWIFSSGLSAPEALADLIARVSQGADKQDRSDH